jgi:N-acetylmuramoyl-L-alanine amidase
MTRRPTARALLAGLALAWTSLGAVPGRAPSASPDLLTLSGDLRVRVREGRSIEVEARVAAGEGFDEVAERVAGARSAAASIADWNSGTVPFDRWVRVPLAVTSDETRSLVLLTLFPRDRRAGDDWIHVARSGALPLYNEGLWQVAEWFAGDGSRFPALMVANGISTPELAPEQEIRIPSDLLHPALRAVAASSEVPLVYGRDASGPYAGYRLRPGEALYSSVVIRFTGRTLPDDVNGVAESLARRSGIKDPRDIPVHYLVKIPFDLLEPEFLPPGHAKRKEAENRRAATEAELAKKPVSPAPKGLRGVLVVLDPGHGGRDLGTIQNGVQEHDYVYDVACRLKRLLEAGTSARVVLTLKDEETGFGVSEADVILSNRQGTIQSSPPFLADDDGESSMAVHLRWYLSNALFRAAVRAGTDPDRVVFVSLHADARHPSLRGLMVYVPGAQHRGSSFGRTDARYARFDEVREAPKVRLTRQQKLRSEAMSRRFGAEIVRSFAKSGLPVQPHVPVRAEVIRGGERWLPAVLRGNVVPTSVLVELVNLANREDSDLLRKAKAREEMAKALAAALSRHFGESGKPGKTAKPAAAARASSR